MVFPVNFGEGRKSFNETHQCEIFFLQFFPFTVTQNVVIFLFAESPIHRIVVFVILTRALIHMFLVNLYQGLVMKFIFLKNLDGPVRRRVLKVGSIELFYVKLSLVFCLKSVTKSGLVDIFRLGQFFSQLFYFLSQIFVVLCRIFIHFNLHFENFSPLCKHQCG